MIIDSIVCIINKNLLAVKYSDQEFDEFERCFDNWADIQYLSDFFNANKSYLKNGFYGKVTIKQAINRTLEEAEALEEYLIDATISGEEDIYQSLQTIFKPLRSDEYELKDLQKSKAYGSRYKSWLRIYAIRIAHNTYVISGSAIKLVATMNDDELLQKELFKLEITKKYLIDNGLIDEDDFQLLQFD